jgi:hypothetical protein
MKRCHDLTGLMKFATRPEWADDLNDALDDHLGPALTEFDIDSDELPGIIGDHWAMTLWGCAFEDLATRVFEPDGRNLVDEYLKRRGWNETGPNKIYMRALKASVMSVYEVSAIEPGVGFLARDLIRGGEPVQVRERTASKTLGQWDRIGARIVPVGGHMILAGGLLSFTAEATSALLEALRMGQGKRAARTKLMIGDDQLRDLAPLISMVWLFDILPGCSSLPPFPRCIMPMARRWFFTVSASPSRVARRRLLSRSDSIPSRRCNGKQPISGTGSGRNQHRARKAPAGWHGA